LAPLAVLERVVFLYASVVDSKLVPLQYFPLAFCLIETTTVLTPLGSLAVPQTRAPEAHPALQPLALYEPPLRGNVIAIDGGVRSIVHENDAGSLVWPEVSLASTRKVWVPSASPLYVFGLVQALYEDEPSREQTNVTLDWESLNEKLAEVEVVRLAGCEVIVGVGGPLLAATAIAVAANSEASARMTITGRWVNRRLMVPPSRRTRRGRRVASRRSLAWHASSSL
jgi:hypothetical protein